MKLQKRLASSIMGCSPKRAIFDPERLSDIKEAITKTDIRRLIAQGIIRKSPIQGTSRARAKLAQFQKSRGRRRGHGSRKGPATARLDPKTEWISRVRTQRELIKRMRESSLIDNSSFTNLYKKVKGGFFRSTRHIKLYVNEQGMVKK